MGNSDRKLIADGKYLIQCVQNGGYLSGDSNLSHIRPVCHGIDNLAAITWHVNKVSDENNDDYIINLHLNETFYLHDQHNKHLFQIRPTQDDNNNPIHWKIIYAGNQSYFIKSNNGYLNGGSNHIRPESHGTVNSGWIRWQFLKI